ncbi:outer membrane protein assembly factor BamC [Chitinimonas koreensis]|uniref:outer membrane protein assembly factor BamC n=1 Tax=Chitinimonas koreensis TaxID=356302 RepID=UPI0004291004|nr:outer membrane protein assembly factor BamC [Chitinimonas koreensis]QNM97985.1 outer membrane protein assembly factor BamC [Chitinimonas koreensis]
MIRSTRTAAALSAAFLAAGCANVHIPFIGGGDQEPEAPAYAQSRQSISNRPLEVPPDLSSPESAAGYAIPGLNGVQLTPEGQKVLETGAVLPKFDKVRMESAGGQRWLVVNAPAEQVWPQARQFWLEQGFKLNIDSPATGILETNYLEQKPELPVGTIRAVIARGLGTLYSTGLVDQYRMRIERGQDPNTTEIYISHRGMEEVFTQKDKSETRWTVRAPEPEREASQLKLLLVRFGVTAEAAAQVVASKPVDGKAGDTASLPAGPARAQLVMLDGKQTVQLDEGFDRSWRRVGLALERAGYSISDRDRSLGLYYIRPSAFRKNKDDGGGFWDKLAFWRDDAKKPGDDGPQGPEYLVIVSGKDARSTVRMANRDGSALPEQQGAGLLQPLFEELR